MLACDCLGEANKRCGLTRHGGASYHTWEAEAGGQRVGEWPGLHSEIMSQKKKKSCRCSPGWECLLHIIPEHYAGCFLLVLGVCGFCVCLFVFKRSMDLVDLELTMQSRLVSNCNPPASASQMLGHHAQLLLCFVFLCHAKIKPRTLCMLDRHSCRHSYRHSFTKLHRQPCGWF
jgi:hypothetical protein